MMLVPSFKPVYTLQYTSTGRLVKIPVMGSPLLLQVHALSPNEHRNMVDTACLAGEEYRAGNE